MQQDRVIDASFWFRTGGLNRAKVFANFRAAYIRIGQGLLPKDVCHDEFYDLLDGMPRGGYFLFDGDHPISEQVSRWANYSAGRRGELCPAADFEPGLPSTSAQARDFVTAVEDRLGLPLIVYANPAVIQRWGYPAWLTERPLWLAWYLFDRQTGRTYRHYQPFFEQRGGALPPLNDRLAYLLPAIERGLWQITNTGDGQLYAANAKTDDPDYPNGIRSIDLNVTFRPVETLLVAPPETGDCPDACMGEINALKARVLTLENRMDEIDGGAPPVFDIPKVTTASLNLRSAPTISGDLILTMPAGVDVMLSGDYVNADGYTWAYLQYTAPSSEQYVGWAAENWLDDPDSPPPPVESKTVTVTAAKAVAMASVGQDTSGKPIIEKNVFAETGDQALRWETGETLSVSPRSIESSGGDRWYSIVGVPLHGYPALYVRKDAVMEVG